MFVSIILLLAIVLISFRIAPRERHEDGKVHGAGQIGLLAAVALFGVDYFTSYFYATGEMMTALHPYGLQKYGYFAVALIALANFAFGALYMYALGVFNEGGGSFTASMRYLGASFSLIVAVVLIQDYVLTIVVSSLSGVDQLLSIINAYGMTWVLRFAIGAVLAIATWFLTIRGRGESASVVFTMLSIFVMLTGLMLAGLVAAARTGYPAAPNLESTQPVTLLQALYHMLTASMKGMVALSGLEAMSNGIQFVQDKDPAVIAWGKKHLARFNRLWNFYSGKNGIGRAVQTSFLFYGGLTTLFLTFFAIRFNVFDGTFGRSLVGNLSWIGFTQLPGGQVLFMAYQILAVGLLASASMTAFQDLQSMAWRNVAIGEIPEVVVYRNPKGTFTRPVTAALIAAIVVTLLVRGQTTLAVPYYGVGVFMPIMAMGLAIRKHILLHSTGWKRKLGAAGASFTAALAGVVFIGQIAGKWTEGGWVVLISLSVLILMAHLILVSPAGYRDPKQIYRIVRTKSRVQGPMGSIVEWQSLKTQEYRYKLLMTIARFWALFGVQKPLRFEEPVPAGEYETMIQVAESDVPTLLSDYLRPKPVPVLGGQPKEALPPEDNGNKKPE